MTVNPGTSAAASIGSISGIDSTVAVYFSPSNPAVSASFSAASLEIVPTTGSRIMYDAAAAAERVLIVGSQANASLQIRGITDTIAVHLLSTGGTIHTYLDPGTTLEGIQSSVGVHLLNTGGTLAVNLGKTDGTITIRTDPGYELGSIKGINSSIATHIGSTGGTLVVKWGPDANVVNTQSTTSIFTVSGSTSGGTTSGVTLVAPSASYNYKVFAYKLMTTALVSNAWRFTNGGESATELWRGLITPAATTSALSGAKNSVKPPGFLFATGVNTTLALRSDSGSLIHYSVSYIKESA